MNRPMIRNRKPALSLMSLSMLAALFCSSCRDNAGMMIEDDTQGEQVATATPFMISTDSHIPAETPEMTSTPEPTPEDTLEPLCLEQHGNLVEVFYESAVLDMELQVQVYTPPCYSSSQEYPAVYFFHGSPPRSADWVQLGVTEQMDEGVTQGRYPPAVLVFPLMPDEIFLWSDGGPGSYEEEYFLGLVPFIEQEFAVVSRGEARSIAGISRGAIWTLEIAMTHPDDFSAAAALSPALQYNTPREQYDPFEIVQRMDRGPQQLFLLAGDTDWARDETEAFVDVLDSWSRPYTLVIAPGGHEVDLWKNALDSVLSFLLVH